MKQRENVCLHVDALVVIIDYAYLYIISAVDHSLVTLVHRLFATDTHGKTGSSCN